MIDIDSAYEILLKIAKDNETFFANNNYLTEADTRANVIDQILHRVLLWPTHEVKREEHVESGYMDYSLKINGKNYVCLEAKKQGATFALPSDKQRRNYKIGGAIFSNELTRDAILQVRGYCDDSVIRFAIVSNGNTWIVFRALREDMPWKNGNAVVFATIKEIADNFIEFWNLLSYSSICNGSLESQFSSGVSSNKEYTRVLNHLMQPDTPLLRNSLHTELHPIITNFFEDITDPNALETLEQCYVYYTSINTVSNDINFVIEDTVPHFLKNERTINILQGPNHVGYFGRDVSDAFAKQTGQLFLLLGGIGAGKTTFQKRYQLTVGKNVLEQNSLWFSLNFLHPPQLQELDKFVWESLLVQLREKYGAGTLETRKNIKRIFKEEIEALKLTALHGISENSPQFDNVLSPYLGLWQTDLSKYVPKLLSLAKPKKGLTVVLFFDNVDQLSPEFQKEIFLLAQRITERVKSITIIALREESYYSATVQKVFTAYINRRFHIASPPFRKMIDLRIRFVLKVMADNSDRVFQKYKDFTELQEKNKITDFLKIVGSSIFQNNANIAKLIESLCFGNMREALQMFSTFLVSGATDVDKMVKIYRRDGNYFIAYHEFIRSIMLGERYYYKESQSSIMNIYECGQHKNASHFTSLRILHILNLHRNQFSKIGEGYFEVSKLLLQFEEAFNNREDFLSQLGRLVERHLVETNTKISETITGSTHIRLTSAGWYYLKYLSQTFAYLDLIFQDTSIDASSPIVQQLVNSLNAVNNIGDPEEQKIPRMEERFNRVSIFLSYLDQQETHEHRSLQVRNSENPIYKLFIKEIIEKFIAQRTWILQRLKENREKLSEDFEISTDQTGFPSNI
jgi:hypothetical protein